MQTQEPLKMQVLREKGRGKTEVWPPLHLQLMKHQLQEKPHGHAFVAAAKMLLCRAFFSTQMQDMLDLTVSYHHKGQSCSLPPPGTHSRVTYMTSSKKAAKDGIWISQLIWLKANRGKKELARDLQSLEWPHNGLILRLHNTRGTVYPPPPLGLSLHPGPSVASMTPPSRRGSMGSWLSS